MMPGPTRQEKRRRGKTMGGNMQVKVRSRSKHAIRKAPSCLVHLLVVFGLLCFVPFTRGQGISGRILGTVQDQSGAVVANVTVTASNQGTGISVATRTDANGQYQFDNLQPGNYKVS